MVCGAQLANRAARREVIWAQGGQYQRARGRSNGAIAAHSRAQAASRGRAWAQLCVARGSTSCRVEEVFCKHQIASE